MTVSDALQLWLTYRAKLVGLDLVAASTHENQRAICAQLATGLGGNDLAALRKSHVEIWVGERLRTCAPVTVRGELNVLRQVLNWCLDEQLLAAKPRLPTVQVPNVEEALPSDEAFLWVLANVPPQHAAALEFMMLTGLSPHELERVQLRDGERQFAVGTSSGDVLQIGRRADFLVKQASRRRDVPLNGRARDLWFQETAGLAPTDCPFPSVSAMQKAIRRAVDAPAKVEDLLTGLPIGLAEITPKLMRKWFASKVAGQQPEHVLQRLMGHAPGSPITRRHYVKSTDAQTAAAVDEVKL